MATIKDVAERAGVTVTTVSRILNNRGSISENTRKKVYAIMEELNYQPNELARALFKKKSNIIGLIIPNVSHPFFAELSNYIESYAYKNGYKILLCNSYSDIAKEKDYIDMLKRSQVDGIIMGSHSLETSDYVGTNLPIVTIDRILSDKIPYISSDNYRGGTLATKLLIDKGCKKIAHISGSLSLNTPANKRYEAFSDVTKKLDIETTLIEIKLDTFDGYKSKIEKLFHDYPNIDGVFASSDIIGATTVIVANLLGKKIPQDLKIIGYDDVLTASLIVPSLTTVKQPIEEMGKLAVELIAKQINKEEINMEHILPVKLIERGTT